ncbi:MAG: acyl-CoA/acyl-ACP dehydrogenase [SAR324 cluster bacterium]|nr:acyl-CoA/acyl-ACP dehydrogenase [SAR324 cluster bacterium]
MSAIVLSGESNGTAWLAAGKTLLDQAGEQVRAVLKKLAELSTKDGSIDTDLMDNYQVEAYRLGMVYSQWQAAEVMVEYAELGELERTMAIGYIGTTIQAIREQLSYCALRLDSFTAECQQFLTDKITSQFIAETAGSEYAGKVLELIDRFQSDGSWNLGEDHTLMLETFRDFAEKEVKPLAEEIHRKDLLIPEKIIKMVKELDCFGLSIPAEYGGFQDEEDNLGIVVVTEALSRGAVIVGSLITRPEILSKALLKGGTEAQKKKWLPKLASGEKLCAVAVTEPNVGSDVAGVSVTARQTQGGWLINGVKTWCTFAGKADLLMVLARSEEDPKLKHKGLSLFIAEKPSFNGHDFEYTQPQGGHISGRAIATIGYRGMHSYEVNFENYFVPEDQQIGGQEGRGKGFYMQMAGFSGGRLQTAARALGVMQAAYEAGKQYAKDRKVFGKSLIDYRISQAKVAQMAMSIQACRQLTYKAARLMNEKKGQMEASMVKLLSCRQAEYVTREALQLHGGMGYAEEYAVSRYFQDARVLSIFEGAEEILALRVVMPALLREIAG